MDLSLFTEHPIFTATLAAYAGSFALYTAAWHSTKEKVARWGTLLLILALAGNTALIIGRWIEAGRPPFKSLFESMVFLAFCIGAVYLAMERLYRTRVFGAPAAAGAVGVMIFALFKWDAEIVNLPPALQSGWFIPHVVVYFVGYGALFFATVVSGVQLVRPTLTLNAGTMLKGAISLEDVSYKAIRLGFVLLTFGLLVGSVWAKAAWGDYWVWDPKENWSLVSWLVYGAYLHLRHVKAWRGDKGAWLAIAGFAVVMFTYLGMNMLPTAAESAHVYTN